MIGVDREILTICGSAQREVVIKKSRFIGLAWPVASEEEALSYLDKAKMDFPGATHYVFAYVLGKAGQIARASDDGEPGGTAGKPVLSAIRLQELTNTLVVVVRYFGGILLGAPGLVRAYSQAAREALAQAGIKKLEPYRKASVQLPYNLLDQVRYQLDSLGAKIEGIEYQQVVELVFFLPVSQQEAAESMFSELMISLDLEEDELYL
jgi:uncharacterized YigZ family protein